MFDSVHPFVVVAAFGGAAALAAMVIAWLVRSTAVRTLMSFLALIFLLPSGCLVVTLNPWLIDARFRTYRAF